MKRFITPLTRILLLTVALVAVFIAANVVPGTATSSSGVSNTQLARGTGVSNGTIPLQEGTDLVIAQNTFAVGGSSGWHSHPGGAIVILKSGELTIYRAVGGQCESKTYVAGNSYNERAGDVIDAVNTGSAPAVVYVLYPRIPAGASARTNEDDPGTCAGL